jgi:hypothetical protein
MTMNTTQYNNPALGCYFDGTYGQTYNDLRVIELAIEYGWDDKEALELNELGEEELKDAMMEGKYEFLSETVQDAEDYLNSLETRPFVSWQWYDGDFGLYANVESAQEDCEFVSHRGQVSRHKTQPVLSEYPPKDYTGEWLHVNDHGNATLYVRQDGEDTEIWSVV